LPMTPGYCRLSRPDVGNSQSHAHQTRAKERDTNRSERSLVDRLGANKSGFGQVIQLVLDVQIGHGTSEDNWAHR
jgi:hypothetical protein